jgi:hypothetical protein
MKELEISQKALDRAEKKQLYRNQLRVCIDNLVCPKCGSDLEPNLPSKGECFSVLKCADDCGFSWRKV